MMHQEVQRKKKHNTFEVTNANTSISKIASNMKSGSIISTKTQPFLTIIFANRRGKTKCLSDRTQNAIHSIYLVANEIALNVGQEFRIFWSESVRSNNSCAREITQYREHSNAN